MRIHDYIKLISEESKFPIGVKIEVICNLEPIMKSDRAYWDVINQMTTGKGVSDFIDRARPKIKEAIEDHFEQANKLTNWLADTQNTTTEKDIRNGRYVFNIYANIKNKQVETKLLDYVRKISSKFEVTDNYEL
jgi:hypothetical protein